MGTPYKGAPRRRFAAPADIPLSERPLPFPLPAARATAVAEAALGIALLSIMDATIKGLSARYAVVEIAFARYAFGSLAMGFLVWRLRPGWPSREAIRANGVRALLVVVTALSFFHGLSALPLAEALALSFLSPILIALFATLLLREPLRPPVLAALLVGFVGVGVVVHGQAEAGGSEARSLFGIAAVLLSALTYALSMVLLRARARRDPVITIVAIQNFGPALILGAPTALAWQAPGGFDLALLALAGLLGVAGHLVLSRAYAAAEAARLAVVEYTAMIWALGIGYAFFDEVPTVSTLVGAGLILAGALIASRR